MHSTAPRRGAVAAALALGLVAPLAACSAEPASSADDQQYTSWEEVLEGYPDLEREDIQQAIEYAAWLTHEEVRTG